MMFDNSFTCLTYIHNDTVNKITKDIRLPGTGTMPSFVATILYIWTVKGKITSNNSNKIPLLELTCSIFLSLSCSKFL